MRRFALYSVGIALIGCVSAGGRTRATKIEFADPGDEQLVDSTEAPTTGASIATPMGAQVTDVPADRAAVLGTATGAVVVGVLPGSPIEAAGISVDDVIVAVGGVIVGGAQDVAAQARAHSGGLVIVNVLREQRPLTLAVSLGGATSTPSGAPTPVPPSPASPTHIEIFAVAVQPPTVARGTTTRLVINYRVEGLPTGGTAPVRERRVLEHAGVTIATLTDDMPRSAGTFTSTKPVDVPADATPGLYTLHVSLTSGPVAAEGRAVFEVR